MIEIKTGCVSMYVIRSWRVNLIWFAGYVCYQYLK